MDGKRRLPLWKSDVVAVDRSEHKEETIGRTKISRKPSTKRRKVNKTHKDTGFSGKRLLNSSDSEEGDDSEELTMEDLLSIAKEYTGTNQTNQPRPEVKDGESESHFNKPPEKTLANPPTATTGDPAQDMLNLFLGPLLKKSQMEEKKSDISNQEVDIIPVTENSVSEVSLPLEKKKRGSLKDKVAMLLQ